MGSAFLRPRVLVAAALRGGEAAATGYILCSRSFASLANGTDIVSAAQGATLQKARSWDEVVSSKFSTTPINEIFKVLSLSSLESISYVLLEPMSCYFQGKKVVIFGLPVSCYQFNCFFHDWTFRVPKLLAASLHFYSGSINP
ncbi:hypothetical protein KSP40_PGU012568 [Platanthera guangdongensis]|uniref:Uncharacterized protein n=1 Tax=Platanthera guangdongensis TaxID=2320717 RepID=A0ABR2M9K2_9ASPA